MYEIVAAVANLSALTVIGFIYVAYIKNLRSVTKLKDEQLKIAEQNIANWKEKCLELERKSPEFVEKLLSERIKIREDELQRLTQDSEIVASSIEQKNKEIVSLKSSLLKATEFRKSYSVWDREKSDFIEVSHSELEQKNLGSICVGAATIMICDPLYLKMQNEYEQEDAPRQDRMYKVVETGEVFCTSLYDDNYDMELLGLDESLTPHEMLEQGLLIDLGEPKSLPAIPETYIKGDLLSSEYRKVRHLSFINGRVGAGITVSLLGDGVYPVYAETYQGEIQRIVIDV
ncbi:TPA: hypothetical protein NJ528_004483 [Vibrio parahaemolyticus]|nr:hypothetical protein [Vibrio parahaemolyticus]HCG8295686.1 hypothetical protein [Vibrio parahaemolyticus]HCG8300909.1 hypothetical protein [Vibrio parahaemolyticus]HCG8311049.1 hypothetical protein [Vibrio parahaemolyticus]HCH0866899.1 hypothetical protein [Vibrio parahaemolyticus]